MKRFFCLLVFFFPAFAYGQPFFIAPSSSGGSDSNTGTEASPFLTIGRAQTAVRAITSSMAADITVYLRGGRYPITSTEAFVLADSGLNGHQVVYQAYGNEKPRLSGGTIITGWTDQGGGIWRASVSGSANFRQLYVAGTRAVRAREPEAGSFDQVVDWNEGAQTIQLETTLSSWGNLTQVEVVILGRGVNESHLRIASINGSSFTPQEPERTRIFEQTYPPKDDGGIANYFIDNALEFLDTDGEWYLDTVNDFLYYNPRTGEDMSTAEVIAPTVETLASVVGTLSNPVHDLEFHGLTFEHSTYMTPSSEGHVGDQASTYILVPHVEDELTSYEQGRLPAAIHVESANDLRFDRNIFRHLGASALNLYVDVDTSTVIGNLFQDVSGGGVSIDLNLEGNPSDARKLCTDDLVSNNYFVQTGQDYLYTVAVMTGYTVRAIIEHNEITNLPYSGISIGWGWKYLENDMVDNIVRYNEIWDVLKLMSDGGGLYTLSAQDGGIVDENYVHDIDRITGLQGIYEINGMFLDQGSGDIVVSDNVFVNIDDSDIRENAVGSGVSYSNNTGTSPTTIANAGLEAAYENIRPDFVPPSAPSGLIISGGQFQGVRSF